MVDYPGGYADMIFGTGERLRYPVSVDAEIFRFLILQHR